VSLALNPDLVLRLLSLSFLFILWCKSFVQLPLMWVVPLGGADIEWQEWEAKGALYFRLFPSQ
jgi:hypothetical protein